MLIKIATTSEELFNVMLMTKRLGFGIIEVYSSLKSLSSGSTTVTNEEDGSSSISMPCKS